MVRVGQMDEVVLEELEEQGGLSKTTINNRKNFLAAFKQWVMENTGKGLEELFATSAGREEFTKTFSR